MAVDVELLGSTSSIVVVPEPQYMIESLSELDKVPSTSLNQTLMVFKLPALPLKV